MSHDSEFPPRSAPTRDLDVRPLLASGREPLTAIMSAVDGIPPGAVLVLRAPFNPRPLHAVLRRRGFHHQVRKRGRRDFEVRYWRDGSLAEPNAMPAGSEPAPPVARTLDVRGLIPPQPLERTLAALDDLPEGAALEQVNDRVPALLIPLLEERGFRYAIGQDARGLIMTIWCDRDERVR